MKILITGASGMLAKSMINQFKDKKLIIKTKQELDITERDDILKLVNNEKPDYIINCAAYTNVEEAEDNEILAERINSDGVCNLALACKGNNSVLIHFSTDYVFDGELDLSKSYNENSVTNPINVYGITKLKGERLIQDINCKHYIIRTSWLFGDGNNFVNKILKLA